MSETWYLLFDGQSEDGRGSPSYIGRTTDKWKAKAHFDHCNMNPYSTGKVVIVTDEKYEMVWFRTNWDKIP